MIILNIFITAAVEASVKVADAVVLAVFARVNFLALLGPKLYAAGEDFFAELGGHGFDFALETIECFVGDQIFFAALVKSARCLGFGEFDY